MRVKFQYAIIPVMLAIATLIFSVSSVTAASKMCGKRTSMIKVLIEKYKETPRALGLSSAKIAMEIYASDSGSWTVMMTMTNGTACIMAAGKSWQELPKALKGSKT